MFDIIMPPTLSGGVGVHYLFEVDPFGVRVGLAYVCAVTYEPLNGF